MPDEEDLGFDPYALQGPPDCIFLLVMKRLDKLASTQNMTSRYMGLHGLIMLCRNFVEDEDLRKEIEKEMNDPHNNFTSDFLRNYKAEISAGTPYTVVLEDEYRKLVPKMERLWSKVYQSLIRQQLLPWTITDAEKQLEGMIVDRTTERMVSIMSEEQRFARASSQSIERMPVIEQIVEDSPRLSLPERTGALSEIPVGDEQDLHGAVNEFDEFLDPDERENIPLTRDEAVLREKMKIMSAPTPIEKLAPEKLDKTLSSEEKPVLKNIREEPKEENYSPTALRRRRRNVLEPVRPYPDQTGVPEEFVVPADCDENVFKDMPDDVDENYMATDEELDEAHRIIARKLRKIQQEKRNRNAG